VRAAVIQGQSDWFDLQRWYEHCQHDEYDSANKDDEFLNKSVDFAGRHRSRVGKLRNVRAHEVESQEDHERSKPEDQVSHGPE
jgi:hypothetical protein